MTASIIPALPVVPVRLTLECFIGEGPTVYFDGFHNPRDRWNGFAVPYFTKEQVETLCDALLDRLVIRKWWWADDGAIVTVNTHDADVEDRYTWDEWYPSLVNLPANPDPDWTLGDHDPLWSVGGGCWTWLLESDVARWGVKA